MPGKRLTDEEHEQIKTLIRSGLTREEIRDRTGRSLPSIQNIRNELKEQESFDNWHVGGMLSKGVPCSPLGESLNKEETKKPKKLNLRVKKKVVRFEGTRTGFEYVVSSDKDELIIRRDDLEFRVEFKNVEKFAEEILDIAVEAENLKKQVDI